MLKFLPVSLYNLPAVETWLSDQARRGWHAEGFTSDALIRGGVLWMPLMRFRRGEPEERQFRLEPCVRRAEAPDQEALDLYAAAGWEYVAPSTRGEFYLWRSTRPVPREVHTDPAAEDLAFGWLAQVQRDQIRLACGFLFLWVTLMLFCILTSQELLLMFITPGSEELLLFPLVLLWRLGLTLLDCKAIRALRKRLSAGVPLPHAAPYRLRRGARRAMIAALLALGVFLGMAHEGWNYRKPWNDFPVPPVAELGVELPMEDPYGTWESGLVISPELWACQPSRDGYGRLAGWNATVYRLRLPFLAGQVLRETAYSNITYDLEEAPVRLENTPFDEARYLRAEDGTQYLVARLDGWVLYYKANVPEDLRDHLDDFAAVLAAE